MITTVLILSFRTRILVPDVLSAVLIGPRLDLTQLARYKVVQHNVEQQIVQHQQAVDGQVAQEVGQLSNTI